MALVPIKTSTGTGYCDCICGCYELCSLRDDETGRGYCYRCGEEHLEMNRKVVTKIPAPRPPASNLPLPPGAKPPAIQQRT
jgi:hypothetical protein